MTKLVVGIENANFEEVDLDVVEFFHRPHPVIPHIPPKRVQKIGARLMQLSKRDGGITPESVVADAEKVKSSPLRTVILKDSDEDAIHNWRLVLARGLVRSVNVIMVGPDGRKFEAPAFYNVRMPDDARKRVYLPIQEIGSSTWLSDNARAVLVTQLMSLSRSLEKFDEFTDVVKAIKKLK